MDFIRVDKQITLSPLTEADFPIFVSRINDYEGDKNTLSIPHPYTQKDAEDALAFVEKRSQKFGKNTSWAIRKNEEVVGGVGFQIYKPSHKTAFGYWLATEFWNRGVMTKVVEKMCEVAFQEYGFQRMEAYVEESNFGSARVLEKCQLKLEAPLIMNYAKKDGELQHCKLFALTK